MKCTFLQSYYRLFCTFLQDFEFLSPDILCFLLNSSIWIFILSMSVNFSVAIADCKFRASVKTSKTHFTFFQFPDRISVYHLYLLQQDIFLHRHHNRHMHLYLQTDFLFFSLLHTYKLPELQLPTSVIFCL